LPLLHGRTVVGPLLVVSGREDDVGFLEERGKLGDLAERFPGVAGP
jgi:hypothetical protein